MIAYLKGSLAYKSPEYIIVDIGGVGYRAFISLNTFCHLPDLNNDIFIYTYTYVREDVFSLYGFWTMDEKNLFLHLIGISGIGPRVAINILSGISPEEFVRAVHDNNVKRFQKIPGVGRKTAERMLLEMKHKMKLMTGGEDQDLSGVSQGETPYAIALLALMNLGYRREEAERSLTAATKKVGVGAPLEKLLKESLRSMA